MIKKILISQPKPASEKSPYYDLANDYGVELVFRPFIKVEGLTSKEFRSQKVSIMNHTAVVFTSRHAIDNYFKLAKEMRIEIPEDMKYFCVTEQIALYIQKYVMYRKRKVFFGNTGKIVDLVPQMVKHKTEKYLIAGIKTLDLHVKDGKVDTVRVDMGAPVLEPEKIPVDLSAAHDAGLKVVIEAPSKEFPSMTAALKNYLEKQSK